MESLILYHSPFPKKRIGRAHDGGYVTVELPQNYDCLISGGIANDISFEQAFLDMYPNIPCYAFDGTIHKLPIEDRRIQFIRKNLGSENSEIMTDLSAYMRDYSNIFMKIDIEGHEFRLFPTLIENLLLDKVKQLVLEVHSPGDIQLYPDYFRDLGDITHSVMFDLLTKINKTHTLVHFHANNGCQSHLVDNILLPNVFECTYIRNDFITKKDLNRDPLPTIYDMCNISGKPDYILKGFPYSEI